MSGKPQKTILFRVLRAAILIYLGVLLTGVFLSRKIIFPGTPPDVFTPGKTSRQYERRFVMPDGVSLEGWLVEQPGKPLVVFYGGNATHAGQLLWDALDMPDYAWLLVNYRGFGASEGSPSEIAVVADAKHVLEQVLRETGRTPADVMVVGESLGSGVAVQVAAAYPVRKLLLMVPMASVVDVAQMKFPFFPVKWILRDTFRSDLAASKVQCPVFIFAATHDRVLPVATARRLRDAFAPDQVQYREYPCDHADLRFSATAFPRDFAQALAE